LDLVGPVLDEVRRAHPGIDEQRLIHEAVRRLIDRMVGDLLSETQRRLHGLGPKSPADVRQAAEPVVAFSDAMRQKERALRQFLFQRMYRHFKVNRMTQKVRRVVRELFEQYAQAPNCLPQEWRVQVEALDAPARARVIGDYIAGMTDRYAIEEHRKLFDVTAAT
jgi:dGTPase